MCLEIDKQLHDFPPEHFLSRLVTWTIGDMYMYLQCLRTGTYCVIVDIYIPGLFPWIRAVNAILQLPRARLVMTGSLTCNPYNKFKIANFCILNIFFNGNFDTYTS